MAEINLSTSVSIFKSNFKISHKTPVLLLGSCFAENIGEQLLENKFDININPCGIIFNPISVVNSLKRIIDNNPYVEKDLIEYKGKWLSLAHHSSFDSSDKTDCLTQINKNIKEAHQHFIKSKTIFITFGSAWVYEHENFGIVANCHKIANKKFTKRLLSVKEILSKLDTLKDDLKDYNLVFTVSPVRHVKDGLHENNLSKSTLLLAINHLIEQNENYSYFPAYELVIDELRDYRFYKDDLIHPTALAINYVWKKFSDTYFDDPTKHLLVELKKIIAATNHLPFNFDSDEHQQFIDKQLALIKYLLNNHSFLCFEKEKAILTKNKRRS